MIPQKLTLSNFICYREASLDFSGIHLACLAGPNGAGKSSLLDAITWALWGKARVRRDDDLITFGEKEMGVEFQFTLGDQLYLVSRRRRVGKRGATALDLHIRDGDTWRSLAETGIRATQARIEQLLRLDYDTFINSAFLRQGHADEFTIKTPAERKQVLANILGLDRWAVYEERAKERLRRIEGEQQMIALRLTEMQAELDKQPTYEGQLQDAEARISEIAAVLAGAHAAYQAVETARAELDHVRAQEADAQRNLGRAQRELDAIEEQVEARTGRVSELEGLFGQRAEIESGHAGYLEAVDREATLGAKVRQSVELNDERVALEGNLAEIRRTIETERDMARQNVTELKRRLDVGALLADREKVAAELAYLNQLAAGREAAQRDLATNRETQAALGAQNRTLREEMEVLKEQLAVLEEASAECPLCRRILTEEHRIELLQQIENEGRTKGDAYRANQAETRLLTEQASALSEQIDETDRLIRGMPGLQRKEAALSERIALGQAAAEDLATQEARLAEVEQRLEAEDYGKGLRDELKEVLSRAAALGYDVAAYEAARRDVADRRVFAERMAQLTAAEMRLVEEHAGLDQLANARCRWEETAAAERDRAAELARRAEELDRQLQGVHAVEQELQRVRGDEAAARQQVGAARQRLEACRALERQLGDRTERQIALQSEAALYEELRLAFGVKGVPAMIIEVVIPEVEADANALLARMTAGRMTVAFETQRETLGGKTVETLEIHIADDLGMRAYESYSGGEQFRVDFAIRIALSKLLARRAGAQLQTLIIDEGFGTQDAEGRERLVEAITAVQDDFARVLVITHIEELKDVFPVRVEITRTERGSQIQVV